ncbi:MAG: hypothetical protein O9267_14590 [Flavobacterium sp.]|uniref:hypothetical protein n=1 Tax=Flavobacterium sp. TaxID=239 RepID=UPI0022BE4987|nr:hypothetical protein [Flavobacterium sp.]MCZ8198825.1 hypothetical protein [Flavobacterium sp.]
MKVITMILLTIFLGKGCSQETKNDLANASIEYIANTRGFYQKIIIQNQEVSISNNRNEEGKGVTTKISDADWKELVNAFETVQLDSLSTYKDPTQKRFYDGAPMAKIKIAYKEKEYESLNFDHGFPPVEIEKLVTKIVSFGKENNDN